MNVNRISSINYSNINNINSNSNNKNRSLGRSIGRSIGQRDVFVPSFGEISTLTSQAVEARNSANTIAEKQRGNDFVNDPLGAISGKFRDLAGMFVPKNQERAKNLQSAIDYYYGLSSNNILNK